MANNNAAICRTRNCAFNQQQITLHIHAYNFQMLHSRFGVAILTCHALTLKYTTRILCHTNRTRHAMGTGVAV